MVTIEIFKTNVATVMIVLLASADVLEAPVLENCHRGVSINLLASVILCEKEVNSLGNFFHKYVHGVSGSVFGNTSQCTATYQKGIFAPLICGSPPQKLTR